MFYNIIQVRASGNKPRLVEYTAYNHNLWLHSREYTDLVRRYDISCGGRIRL